jgi:hypothetical protein
LNPRYAWVFHSSPYKPETALLSLLHFPRKVGAYDEPERIAAAGTRHHRQFVRATREHKLYERLGITAFTSQGIAFHIFINKRGLSSAVTGIAGIGHRTFLRIDGI